MYLFKLYSYIMELKPYTFLEPKFVPFDEVVNDTIGVYKAVDKALAENTIHVYAGSYNVCTTPLGNCSNGMVVGCSSGYNSVITCPAQPGY